MLIVSRRSRWADWARELEAGTTNDGKLAAHLRRAIAADDVAASAAAYLEVFFTDEGRGKPRGGEANRIVTQTLAKRAPDLPLQLANEQQRLATLRDRLYSAEALERSVALYTIAARAEALRRAQGRARHARFRRSDRAHARAARTRRRGLGALQARRRRSSIFWSTRRRTRRPRNGRSSTKLCEEFLSGAGARERPRTFFAVGDEKQSIFSFQGAAPHMFAADAARVRAPPPQGGDCPSSRSSSPCRSAPRRRCSRASIECSPPEKPGAG